MPAVTKKQKIWIFSSLILLAIFIVCRVVFGIMAQKLEKMYSELNSQTIFDRNGQIIQVLPNSRGNFDRFLTSAPRHFSELLLKKEDRWFYFHPGVNPISLMRDLFSWITTQKRSGSSTITQQLAKTLLTNENRRTWYNKVLEFFYAESLEWNVSKKQILLMYENTAYFGNQAQGLQQASLDYFNVPPENLNDAQILSLLSALNSPSTVQPGTAANLKQAKKIAAAFKINLDNEFWKNLFATKTNINFRKQNASFETGSLNLDCNKNCNLTLDQELTQNIRDILKRNLASQALDSANNGAVVVIKLPENEILSVVGSPQPEAQTVGMQLNMALKPRPIGSTSKPFIYLNAFEKGARPFSLVDDTEIKYQVGTGFDFFPKNFDGQFRGIVTLHQALDNSLNVPSVQVLEFVGLENFYNFLLNNLHFKPLQPLQNYELGIALGGLESDLLTLSHYFTIFPQQGLLKPLVIYKSGYASSPAYQPPMENTEAEPKAVAKEAYIELINKVLNDRDTGIDQFGIKSNLNLPFSNYALKTGTSRDYHDSWTMGYTPDFLVGVWVGNSDNKPMRQITGLSGAAKIWREVMQTMYASGYNKNTPFKFEKVKEIQTGNTLDFGLSGDEQNLDAIRQIMLNHDLILSPHDGDKFLLNNTNAIPLTASKKATWIINGKIFADTQKTSMPVTAGGSYTIIAKTDDGTREQITITITNN